MFTLLTDRGPALIVDAHTIEEAIGIVKAFYKSSGLTATITDTGAELTVPRAQGGDDLKLTLVERTPTHQQEAAND